MYLASSILMYINKKSRPRVELFFLVSFFSMSAWQCKAQIRPRPVIFVWVFLVLSKKYSKFRRKKMWHYGLEEFILKKSISTNRKCDMVSIQYLYMLRIEIMNAWTDARSVQLFSNFPRFDLFGFFLFKTYQCTSIHFYKNGLT